MKIHHSAIHLLSQLTEIISQLSSEQYTLKLPVLNGSTVGQHSRHMLEFFLCIIEGASSGELNYDQRKRDTYLETDPKFALSIIKSIQESLEKGTSDLRMELKANYSLEFGDEVEIQTTYLRELAYNIEHSIHHMALMKIGLKQHFSEINIPENFGVASSTVRHQNSQNA